jgi:hypothetical protein
MPALSPVDIFAGILAFVMVFGIFVTILALTVPLTGTLVRYRASYNPRGVALDAEGGTALHTGPVINSYFGMMARVYRIEVLLHLAACIENS